MLMQMIYHMVLKYASVKWDEKQAWLKIHKGYCWENTFSKLLSVFYMTEMWMGSYRNWKQSIIADYPVN